MEEANTDNETQKEGTENAQPSNIENVLIQPANSNKTTQKQPTKPKQKNSNPRRKQNNAMSTEKLNRLLQDPSQQPDKQKNRQQTKRQQLPHLSQNDEKGNSNQETENENNQNQAKNEQQIPQTYLIRTAYLEKKNKKYQQTVHNRFLQKQPLDSYRESIADRWITAMKCTQRSTKRRKYPQNHKLPPMEEHQDSKQEQQTSDTTNAVQPSENENAENQDSKLEQQTSDLANALQSSENKNAENQNSKLEQQTSDLANALQSYENTENQENVSQEVN